MFSLAYYYIWHAHKHLFYDMFVTCFKMFAPKSVLYNFVNYPLKVCANYETGYMGLVEMYVTED